MSRPPSDKKGPDNPEYAEATEAFVAQLTAEERMLVILKSQLYDETDRADPDCGTGWHAMLVDLHNRLEGKPYLFKLANRITDDIARIEKLRDFEQRHNVKLADYIKPPAPPTLQ